MHVVHFAQLLAQFVDKRLALRVVLCRLLAANGHQ